MIPLSVLDLSSILQGSNAAQALRNSLDLAQHCEQWQYKRFWLAEHHNMPGNASSATAVVIGHVAGGTKTIRVGSGGIMLPNHAPLIIAEQFGTLDSLHPGRIDLGVGRAPGTDQFTARALRRDLAASSDSFPHDIVELQALLGPPDPGQRIRAVPGTGLNVPIWILGSSLFGAQLAAALGLPFAFASHFAPASLVEALRVYRDQFKPSQQLDRSYAMVSVNVFAADDAAKAKRLFTSHQQQFVNLRRGTPGQLPPPVDSMDDIWSPAERVGVEQTLAFSIVGTASTVEQGLKTIIAETGADEVMVSGQFYDHAARLRSYEIVADVKRHLAKSGA